MDATCTHCRQPLRTDGLQLVAMSDDLAACPDAPLVDCSPCGGAGCGSCEGHGRVFGRHEASAGLAYKRSAYYSAERRGTEAFFAHQQRSQASADLACERCGTELPEEARGGNGLCAMCS